MTVPCKSVCVYVMPLYAADDNNAHREYGIAVLSGSSNGSAPSSQHEK